MAADQMWMHWGLRSRHYTSDADNALFYEAEGRTPLGGAATATGTAPASGSAPNVVRQGTLTPGWQAMLSTQATGGGSHLEHIGIYEFWARVFMPAANTGAVSIRLDWGEGDFRRVTPNAAVTFDADHGREGQWILVNLGQVFLKKVAQGTQRWEGRIVAKSTVAGDDLDVDCFWLRPLEEGNGTARGLVSVDTPSSFSARSEFDTESGAITGDSAAVGGVWVGAGDADDFSVAAGVATRTAVSDTADIGRYAVSGVAGFTAQLAQIDFRFDTDIGAVATLKQGVIARYTDVNNWVRLEKRDATRVRVMKRVAGTIITVSPLLTYQFSEDVWYTLRLVVHVDGRYFGWVYPTGSTPGNPQLLGQDADFATGGALASGKPGFYDEAPNATAVTRNYDNFQAWVPVLDAAVFASQSLEVRHDRVIREDSGGTIWTPVSDYTGDYLLVPPAGMEGRTSEILVKASRTDPDWGPDSAIDDVTIDLEIVPRYLKIPEP